MKQKNNLAERMNKIGTIMSELGCEQVRPLIFRHPLIDFDLDFTATSEDKVILRLAQIFSEKGRSDLRKEFREFIGL